MKQIMMGRCSKGYNTVVTCVKELLTLVPGVGEGFTVCEFNFEMQIRIYQVDRVDSGSLHGHCMHRYIHGGKNKHVIRLHG